MSFIFLFVFCLLVCCWKSPCPFRAFVYRNSCNLIFDLQEQNIGWYETDTKMNTWTLCVDLIDFYLIKNFITFNVLKILYVVTDDDKKHYEVHQLSDWFIVYCLKTNGPFGFPVRIILQYPLFVFFLIL